MAQALLKITGRVQGVFYRAHAAEQAKKLSLRGYAKNMPDNSVEVLVQGPPAQIEAFASWCREGSPSAQVDDVQITWQSPSEELPGFRTF